MILSVNINFMVWSFLLMVLYQYLKSSGFYSMWGFQNQGHPTVTNLGFIPGTPSNCSDFSLKHPEGMPPSFKCPIVPSHCSLTTWLLQSMTQLQGMLSDCFIDHAPAFFSPVHIMVEFSMFPSFYDQINHSLKYWRDLLDWQDTWSTYVLNGRLVHPKATLFLGIWIF